MSVTGRRAARRDANEPDIVQAMRRMGMDVWYDLPVDLLVYFAGQLIGVEIKDGAKPPSRRLLTDIESNFLYKIDACGAVIKSVDEALGLRTRMERRRR